MKKHIDYFELLTKTMMWILGIIVIYMLILKIIGHSPTTETVLISFIGIITISLLNLYYRFGEFNNFIKETFPRFERNIKESFKRLKEDLVAIKDK